MSDDQILAALARLEAGQAGLEAGQAGLEAGQAGLVAGQAGLVAGQAGLVAGQAGLEAGQAGLEAGQAGLVAGQAGLVARMDRLDDRFAGLRVDLMARMDRLQDALTEQRGEADTLLDLLVANQRVAERGGSEARSAFDVASSNTMVLTQLMQKVVRLEEQVRELREGR